MHMDTTNLSFEKALEILSQWCVASYSSLVTRSTIIEVLTLSVYEMRKLCQFDNWYVSTNLENSHVRVVIMND